MKKIAVINGPNLNMLGKRDPSIYGTKSMEQVMVELQKQLPDVHLLYRQSNHEGDLIDWLQELGVTAPVDGIILNAGGYTHTSVALRDAIEMSRVRVVEVHISDITTREDFRKKSLLSDVCTKTIMGIGTDCYAVAARFLLEQDCCSSKIEN